jgi:hypothetical protein
MERQCERQPAQTSVHTAIGRDDALMKSTSGTLMEWISYS